MSILKSVAIAAIALSLGRAAAADEADPCSAFKWDVSHERALMEKKPQAVKAAAQPGASLPQLETGRFYRLALLDQSGVKFALSPEKQQSVEGSRGGLVRIRADKAGIYRISLSTPHWIDVVDGGTLIKSRDFQGQRGCERPHKVVEFELPAGRDLTLQLSGFAAAEVLIAVTRTPAG